MGWRDLLQTEDESVVAPWVGGRSLQTFNRTWKLQGRLPPEHGWHCFTTDGRTAKWSKPAEPSGELRNEVRGYLVGDRLLADDVRVDRDPAKLIACSEPVFLIEPGLDRFVRVLAGRSYEDGPLIYSRLEFPLGPEEAVLQAYLDSKLTVDHVPGVAPALDAAFRFEVWQRVEAERRRREEEERRRAEEAKRAAEERRQRIVERLGDAAGRREMAAIDFAEAARAALAVGGAEYLDHRRAVHQNEMAVRFRFDHQRFECTCDARTLRIIDAGICLTDHDTYEKGDTRFTLESFPGVIREAIREGKLVVFRHVG
jgi:hypothetical protein